MMTHDKATDTTDCELPDAQTEATTSSLFCTVLHFSKCLTQQTAFTVTNILNEVTSSAAMYIATYDWHSINTFRISQYACTYLSHGGEIQQCKNVRILR